MASDPPFSPVSADDAALFRSTVQDQLDRVLPDPQTRGGQAPPDLWSLAAEQGWLELGGEGALGAAVAAVRALGRSASAFPLMDAFVAARILGGDQKTADAIVAGEVRPLAALEPTTGARIDYLDSADSATHVLTLPPGGGTARLRPIEAVHTRPGLAAPDWSSAQPGAEEAAVEITAAQAAEAVDLLAKYDIPAGGHRGSNDELSASVNPDGAAALLDVAMSHRISLIANALGPPPPHLVERAHNAGVVVASLVGQRKHAVRQLDAGVDVLIAQGTEAGGHTGTIATTVLTPEIVDIAGGKPVLAAGGIASGRQMAAALALGAAGVWCGSVWLSSQEDITPRSVKEKFLAAGSGDTLRSPTRTGKPARQLRSAWHDEWERPNSPVPLPMPLQPMLVNDAWARIDAAAEDGHEGARELESFFIGQVVGSFSRLRPAGDIARQLVADCDNRLTELAALTDPGTTP